MRFTRLIALVVGLLLPHMASAAATEPQRWVSAGGALTEWIVALGGESRLVGVDSTSQHPASVKSLPGIGYQRQLSAEGILTLRPQMLLGTEEIGPPPVIQQLRTAGVQVEVLSASATARATGQPGTARRVIGPGGPGPTVGQSIHPAACRRT